MVVIMTERGLDRFAGVPYSARDFFTYARSRYLASRGLGPPVYDEPMHGLLCTLGTELGIEPDGLWGTKRFQYIFRATNPRHLGILGFDDAVSEAQRAVSAGRVMSILPYNAVMGETTVRKFIPSMPDKFSGKWRHSMDPYGIFEDAALIEAVDERGNRIYLASRKFPYAVLANVTEFCPVGCDGCYKGSVVRTSLSESMFAGIKEQLVVDESRAVQRAELLTRWLNRHSEVSTIIISGGEPTVFSDETLGMMLEHYADAEHVSAVRLCTSSVFQGMWYRITDDFTSLLAGFERKTGKQVYINAHVTDEFQLGAPEARMAVDALTGRGITIHLQMPLQEGINFHRDDISRSAARLQGISEAAYRIGVIPYKMIVDMHSSSHPSLTVPIETVSRTLAVFDRHMECSDMGRWQAVNVLTEQGNLYLYPYPHFTAAKEITRDGVIYFIPKINPDGSAVIHAYREPLIAGHNDDPNSIQMPADSGLLDKISRVRERYHVLQEKIAELGTDGMMCHAKRKVVSGLQTELYRESGIVQPENEPLII